MNVDYFLYLFRRLFSSCYVNSPKNRLRQYISRRARLTNSTKIIQCSSLILRICADLFCFTRQVEAYIISGILKQEKVLRYECSIHLKSQQHTDIQKYIGFIVELCNNKPVVYRVERQKDFLSTNEYSFQGYVLSEPAFQASLHILEKINDAVGARKSFVFQTVQQRLTISSYYFSKYLIRFSQFRFIR